MHFIILVSLCNFLTKLITITTFLMFTSSFFCFLQWSELWSLHHLDKALSYFFVIVWCRYYFIINCSGWNDLFLSLLHSCSILQYLNNRLWRQAIMYIAHECSGFVFFDIHSQLDKRYAYFWNKDTPFNFHVNICWTKNSLIWVWVQDLFQNRSYSRQSKFLQRIS